MEVNICRDWIIKCVVTKSVLLKVDNGGDTLMSSDAIYFMTCVVMYMILKVNGLVLLVRIIICFT